MLIPLVELISQSTAHTSIVCGYPRLHAGDTTQPEVAGGSWGIPFRDTLSVIVPRGRPGGCRHIVMSTCFSLESAPNYVLVVPWGHHVHVVPNKHQTDFREPPFNLQGEGGLGFSLFIPTGLGRALKISDVITCLYRTIIEIPHLVHANSARNYLFQKYPNLPPREWMVAPLDIWCF